MRDNDLRMVLHSPWLGFWNHVCRHWNRRDRISLHSRRIASTIRLQSDHGILWYRVLRHQCSVTAVHPTASSTCTRGWQLSKGRFPSSEDMGLLVWFYCLASDQLGQFHANSVDPKWVYLCLLLTKASLML